MPSVGENCFISLKRVLSLLSHVNRVSVMTRPIAMSRLLMRVDVPGRRCNLEGRYELLQDIRKLEQLSVIRSLSLRTMCWNSDVSQSAICAAFKLIM